VFYLLSKALFNGDDWSSPMAVNTKWFQHIEMRRLCATYLRERSNVAEIGPRRYFTILEACAPAKKYVIDPYNAGPGGGELGIPEELPYPIGLFRCSVGDDSAIIPSRIFDATFSMSVIEHIGQAEAGYDCNPTPRPPKAQEERRTAFCRELFRITRPGGITIHTVDHAARNLSFIDNFLRAGFRPLAGGPRPSVEECRMRPDLVRQKRTWDNLDEEMPLDQQHLHSVLVMGFVRPLSITEQLVDSLTRRSDQAGSSPAPRPGIQAGAGPAEVSGSPYFSNANTVRAYP
jgi:hypothetical protein